MLFTTSFSFFHIVFKKHLPPGCFNLGLCGKGLNFWSIFSVLFDSFLCPHIERFGGGGGGGGGGILFYHCPSIRLSVWPFVCPSVCCLSAQT